MRDHYGLESWSKSNYGKGSVGGCNFAKAGMVKPKPPSDKPLEKAVKSLLK